MWVLRFQYGEKSVLMPVAKPEVRAGCAEGNDVVLRVQGVSRSHCVFYLAGDDGSELRVKDLRSRLGVLRDEEALKDALLQEGDCLSLGPVWVFVQRESSSDWRTRAGESGPARVALGASSPAAGLDTAVPSPELLPMELLAPCLEALGRDDWGSRWAALLGLSNLEILCEQSGESLCRWPSTGASEGANQIAIQTPFRQWSAVWNGGRRSSRSVLKALLLALDALQSATESCSPSAEVSCAQESPLALEDAWKKVEGLVQSDLPILIRGETGVGKEVLARAIHSARGGASRFIVVHCAAIPESLFESELFGIEPKTATGVGGRKGQLEAAEGGTVLLDEVGEIPAPAQAKLLRVLEDSTVQSVGARRPKPLKVRWLSATNRNLRQAIREGRFREDLYFRLRGAEVEVLPLGVRSHALPALVEHFLREFEQAETRRLKGLSREAYRALLAYQWPGNVRELKAELKRAYLLAEQGGLIQAKHLSPSILEEVSEAGLARAHSLDHRRAAVERAAVEEALRKARGNVSKAASLLNIARPTLYRRLQEMSLDPERYKE